MYQAVSQRLPSIDSGLSQYLTQIRKFPILTQEEETSFARRWRQQGDREAAYRLVTSHLRLVAKIAMRYRGYGLPIADLVSGRSNHPARNPRCGEEDGTRFRETVLAVHPFSGVGFASTTHGAYRGVFPGTSHPDVRDD